MGKQTGIAWTDHTFNLAWGCLRVSPGCENCYADELATNRFKVTIDGKPIWGSPTKTARRTFGEQHWAEPLAWNREAAREGRRHRVFSSSMADVFEQHETIEAERRKLWELIAATPWLDWQLLTKRAHRINHDCPWGALGKDGKDRPYYLENCWVMTSVENQQWATKRLPHLIKVRAPVRGVSYEPALEPVDFRPWLPFLDWVIVGAESSWNARPMADDLARSVRDQCLEYGVAFFFKQRSRIVARQRQDGSTAPFGIKLEHPLLDGVLWEEFPTPRQDYLEE